MEEGRAERWWKWGAWAVIAVFVLLRLWMALFLGVESLLHYTNDDTCYYLEIGRHIAAGDGPTFDGLHQTNGFHPLWQLVASIPFLLGAGTLWGCRLFMAFSVLVFAAAALLGWKAVERRYGVRAAALVVILLGWPQFINNACPGMETVLAMALVLAALAVCDRHGVERGEASAAREWLVGVLLALLFLSRLDTAFVHLAAGIAFLAAWIRHRRERGWFARGVRLFGPSALALVAYLAWNLAFFGHALPISAALKSSFPQPGLYLYNLEMFRELGVLTFLAVVWLFIRWKDISAGVRILAVGCAAQFAYYLFFLSWAPFAYYLVALGLPVIILATGDILARIVRRRLLFRVTAVLTLAGVLAGEAYSLLGYTDGDLQRPAYRAAQWAREHTTPDTVFAMRDCGIFGYFSERPTINLDGLVNDYAYQEALSAGRLEEYLRTEGVSYFVHHAVDFSRERLRLVIPSRLYGGESVLEFPCDAALFRTGHYEYSACQVAELAVWPLSTAE